MSCLIRRCLSEWRAGAGLGSSMGSCGLQHSLWFLSCCVSLQLAFSGTGWLLAQPILNAAQARHGKMTGKMHTQIIDQKIQTKTYWAIWITFVVILKQQTFSFCPLLQPFLGSTSMSTMAATSHLGGVNGLDWSKILAFIITLSVGMDTRRSMVQIMPRYVFICFPLWFKLKASPDKLQAPLTYKYRQWNISLSVL